MSEDFARLLDTDLPDGLAQCFSPSEPVMIQLSHVTRAYRGHKQTVGDTGRVVVKPYGAIWLASGYFITLAAAKNLLARLYPVWTVADHWIRFQEKGLLTLQALSPNAVWESAEAQNSSISPERRPRHKPRRTLATRVRRMRHELLTKPFLVKRLPQAE